MSTTRDRSVSSISNFAIQDFGALPASSDRDAASIRLVMPSGSDRVAPAAAPSHDTASLTLAHLQPEEHRAAHAIDTAHRDFSNDGRFFAPSESARSHTADFSAVQNGHRVFGDHSSAAFSATSAEGQAAASSFAVAPNAQSFAISGSDMMQMAGASHSRQGDFSFDQAGHGAQHAPPPAGAIAGQLWMAGVGNGIGNPDGHSDFRVEHLDSDGLSDSQIIEQEQVSSGIYQAIGLDTSARLSFSLDSTFHLRVTNMVTGVDLTNTVVASTADQDVMNCFVVNADTNTIFAGLFGYDYLADGGDIIKISYNQTTGAISSPYSFNDTTHAFSINLNNVLIDSTSTGHVYADARAMYLSHDGNTLYYTDDNNNDPGNFWGFSTNGVFKVSTSGSVGGGNAPTPVLLSSQAQFPVNDSNGYINGITVDEARSIIYFTTASSAPGVNPSQNAIWWMPITGGTATKMTIPGGVSVTYPVFYGESLALDPKNHILYYSDQSTGEIVQFTLSGDGHSFASAVNFALFDTNHASDGAYANDLIFDDLPTLSALTATTTEAVQGGSAITLLTAAPTITDTDNLRLAFMTVTVTNAQAGDNLFCNGAQSGTVSGVTISWNASTHTLTLSGDVAFSTYQSLMNQISFQDSGTDNSTGSHPTRTINWTVSDGVTITHASTADSNEQTTTVVIDRAPTLTADSYAVVETATKTGTSGTAGTGVLGNDNDKDADAIAVTAVQGSGGNVGSSVAGTYGHLTLNANGSYSYTADNAAQIAAAANGSHPVDTFTYTVSDGLGGVTSSTVSFTIDRVPTVVADNPAGQALEAGSAITGNVLTNDSDKDGDTLTVSAVQGSGGNVGGSVAGNYGHMTINANGSYSYSADITAAIDGAATGSHLTDTFTYTADDGHGGTTTTSITVTLDRAPTVVTDSASLAESASVTKNAAQGVLANDSDRDGDSLTVSAVAGSGGNVGISVATTYGHITLNADGSYTYNADNTSTINAAANGSHPIDTISFTVSDGHGGTTTETLSFTIDRPAVATADSLSTAENASAVNGSGGNANLLANDTDKDGDAITITAVNGSGGNVGTQITLASGALLTVNADGTYTYDPNHAFDYLPGSASGASNQSATDTFTYTIDGGATVTVTITINGVDSNDTLIGTAGADTLHGGIGDDTINSLAGNDTIFGDSGNDVITMTSNLTAADKIDGGTNIDRVILNGDYSAGVVFNATTMVNVELLSFAAGHSYNLTMDNATVAAGQTLKVQAGSLGVGDNVTFDASADTSGGNYVITTGAGDDTLTGGWANDRFNTGSGTDTVHGGGGDDRINLGAFLTAADTVDGGSGTDLLHLKGDYSAGVVFGASTMTNIEFLSLTKNFDYNLTMNAATVAAGETLTVRASSLGAGDNVTFDGSADTAGGSFVINTGGGDDVLTGGWANDVFRSGSGTDTVHGGGGDDQINAGAFLTAADTFDGGSGTNDSLVLDGNYSAGVTFSATTVTNIESITVSGGHDYKLIVDNATVALGSTLTVRGEGLGAGDKLYFDGSADMTGGTFNLRGGLGNDTLIGGYGDDVIRGGDGANHLTGGGGMDTLYAGTGADQFVYNAVSDSTSTIYDHIVGFDGSADTFRITGVTVNAVDAAVNSGHLTTTNFDADLASAIGSGQLSAHDAVLFTATTGNLHGHTFLIVDINGTAGYQAGQDLVIDVTGGTNLGSLNASDFFS